VGSAEAGVKHCRKVKLIMVCLWGPGTSRGKGSVARERSEEVRWWVLVKHPLNAGQFSFTDFMCAREKRKKSRNITCVFCFHPIKETLFIIIIFSIMSVESAQWFLKLDTDKTFAMYTNCFQFQWIRS